MRLFVPLTKTEFDALKDLARAERRRPQDQAAAMLARVLSAESSSPRTNNEPSSDRAPQRDPERADRVSA